MGHTRLHLKNSVALLASGAFSKLLVLLATIQIFKGLSVEDNGVFVLALTFGFIFTTMTELGVRGYLLRELARIRTDLPTAQQVFGTVVNVRLFLTVVVVPLFGLVLWLTGYGAQTIVFSTWFLAYSLLDSFAMLLKFALRGYERMEFDALFSVFGRGMILLFVAGFSAFSKLTLSNVALSHILGALLECVGLCLALRRVTSLRLLYRFDWSAVRYTLVRSIPFAVVNLVGILYLRTGTVLLSKLLSGNEAERAVAYFGAAARLPEAANFIPIAIVNALIPFLSRYHGNRVLVQRYYGVLVRYLGFAGVLLGVVFLAETQWLILTVSKREYLVATRAFQWYGGWILLTFLQYAMANLLICLNEERIVMRCYGLAFVVNIALNLLLIPKWGVTGAAAALTMSEFSTTMLDYAILRRRGMHLPWSILLEIAAVGASAFAVLWILHPLPALVRVMGAGVGGGIVAVAVAWRQDQSVLLKILGREPEPDSL